MKLSVIVSQFEIAAGALSRVVAHRERFFCYLDLNLKILIWIKNKNTLEHHKWFELYLEPFMNHKRIIDYTCFITRGGSALD